VSREVDDLLECLRTFGAAVYRDGHSISIQGPLNADNCSYSVAVDATYCGTVAMASAMTGRTAQLPSESAIRMKAIIPLLCAIGLKAEAIDDGIVLSGSLRSPVVVETGDSPAFPSDLVPPLMALLTQVHGESRIIERVYPGRFDHVAGLVSMGADCSVTCNEARVVGGKTLSGSRVQGTGIRETAALLLAALNAQGTTEISNAAALARGYEDLPGDLAFAGADVKMSSTDGATF